MEKRDADTVAKWMLAELERVNFLYQEIVVREITDRFGEEFAYINDNGNQAIDRTVLSKFKKLTGDSVVWDRGQRMWRKRETYDSVNRGQH